MNQHNSNFERLYNQLIPGLVPLLSTSLKDKFNVFRVMHHGTHEKQISNVFSWLLHVDGTHRLGNVFQRIFITQINRALPERSRLPTDIDYDVDQEVDTSLDVDSVKDISDIVLSCKRASIIVENFKTSDGHGHDYYRYLAYGATGGKQSVVVLLCANRELYRLAGGWEQSIVITYAELLEPLKVYIARARAWRRLNQQQNFFITQMLEHFLEGYERMSAEDQIAFIKLMCDTGESKRYGERPHEQVAQQFADLIAEHAKRQFEESRETLSKIKRRLKEFSAHVLLEQVNRALGVERISSVKAPFVGRWEWCVTLCSPGLDPDIFIDFGPTAVVENAHAPKPIGSPDYTKLFVSRQVPSRSDGIDYILQTDVGLIEIMQGLGTDDTRLRDAVIHVIQAG